MTIKNPQHMLRVNMGLVGLEPTTSRLSGVRSNHLSYRPLKQGQEDSNPRHPVLETDVLPTELYPFVSPIKR